MSVESLQVLGISRGSCRRLYSPTTPHNAEQPTRRPVSCRVTSFCPLRVTVPSSLFTEVQTAHGELPRVWRAGSSPSNTSYSGLRAWPSVSSPGHEDNSPPTPLQPLDCKDGKDSE